MRRASGVAVTVAVAMRAVLGCTPPNDRVADAAEWAHPYLAQFAQFDQWARRAGASDAVLQSRDALRETTFAPIRRDVTIVAAWVHVDGQRAFTLALPHETELPAPRWIALRDPGLGALRAARLADCAALAPAAAPCVAPACTCVLISRAEAPTTVTVAFRRPPPAAASTQSAPKQ